jgi:hypothetical protein
MADRQGHKDIENRSWKTTCRGPILIHAGKGVTLAEYNDAWSFAKGIDPKIQIPAFDKLERGGIIGAAEIIDCVAHSDSRWYFGEFGLVLANAMPLPFYPLRGMLSFSTRRRASGPRHEGGILRAADHRRPADPRYLQEQATLRFKVVTLLVFGLITLLVGDYCMSGLVKFRTP